jgi:NUMOD3 motif/HNH endonuclease
MGNTNQEPRRSRATRKKISEARKRRHAQLGHLNTPETRKKIGEAGKGRPAWNKGKRFSKKSRQKMSVAALIRFATSENHPAWKGGISFDPYPPIFNGHLKRLIKERDSYTCQLCSITEEEHYEQLSVHHIDYDKNNCAVENLITLCRACNSRVNFRRDQWLVFFTEKVQRV